MDPQATQKRSLGPVVGIVIIIAVLIVGAFYIWGGKLWNSTTPSEDLSQIEADLAATGALDIDLSDIEAELQ